MNPVRLQRKRTKGFDLQALSRATNGLECVSVTRPGRWGNPFDVARFGRELSLKLFRESVREGWNPFLMYEKTDELCSAAYEAHIKFIKRFVGEHPVDAARSELRGRDLACYCGEQDDCHADILLEIISKT